MAEWAKIALKLGLVSAFTIAVFVLFTAIQFPAFSLTQDIINGIAFAKGYLTYWLPNFSTVWGFTFVVIVFELGLLGYKFAVQTAKWLWKVVE